MTDSNIISWVENIDNHEVTFIRCGDNFGWYTQLKDRFGDYAVLGDTTIEDAYKIFVEQIKLTISKNV